MRVALVRCVELPEIDPDERPGLAAFRSRGHEAAAVSWDDPGVDWGAFDALLIRATWNYYEVEGAFRAWLDRVEGPRLLNSARVVRWNMQKGYLLEMERAGVSVVPTVLVRAGEAGVFRWDDVVVKPAVGAGSWLTERFTDRGAAVAYIDRHRDRDMLVQPYMQRVAEGGERSIVWIDGAVSHVVEKSPRFAGEEESVRSGGAVGEAEEAFAHRAVEVASEIVGERPLYARVDVISDDDGSIRLSELELIEPSLFLDLGEGSGEMLVRAVEGAVASVGG